MNAFAVSIIDLFKRAGAGFSASQQGEYLQGWLPAMAERPQNVVAADNNHSDTWQPPCALIDYPSHAKAA